MPPNIFNYFEDKKLVDQTMTLYEDERTYTNRQTNKSDEPNDFEENEHYLSELIDDDTVKNLRTKITIKSFGGIRFANLDIITINVFELTKALHRQLSLDNNGITLSEDILSYSHTNDKDLFNTIKNATSYSFAKSVFQRMGIVGFKRHAKNNDAVNIFGVWTGLSDAARVYMNE